jgi:3',5'-cyclic AMP phosphodiesterase CpdA
MLTILHLSDLHFSASRPYDAKSTPAYELLDSFVRQAREPDLCIISGDLTFSASRADFVLVTDWLDKLASLQWKTPLFIVPGNHDICRRQAMPELGHIYPDEHTYMLRV